MDIRGDIVYPRVREREIDYFVVQLLESDPDFREMFASELFPTAAVEYHGCFAHAEYADKGETDLEVGFRTGDGNDHLLLIENKIDAAFGERQVERYHERGAVRLREYDWDDYTVCLLAPESYLGRETVERFDQTLSYESLAANVRALDYDGADFIAAMIDQALQVPDRDGTVTSRIATALEQRRERLPGPLQFHHSPQKVQVRSTHQDHPDHVLYDCYVINTPGNLSTNVRMQIERGESPPYSDAVKATVQDHLDELDGFSFHPDQKNFLVKTIWHDQPFEADSDAFVRPIVGNLEALLTVIHPALTESDIA